ncbi:MAG: hypothetical protein ACREN7_00925 [Candidatus Dormibacteria bacterium]
MSRARRSRGPVQSGLFIPLPEDWRSCILPAIGLVTPVGLLVVNFSAWVISQLDAWRWGVAVSAFISALILNSLTAVNIYRYIRNRWPHWPICRQENSNWVLAGAIFIILVTAFFASLFSYVGMANPKRLPDGIAVLTGFLGLIVPLGLSVGLNRRHRTDETPIRS